TSFIQRIKEEALKERLKKAAGTTGEAALQQVEDTPSTSVQPALSIPQPPFWGPRVLGRIGIEDVAPCMDLNTLFRLHWGGKTHGADFTRLAEMEFRPRLKRMLLEARQRRYLQPKVIYGYFPCQASGNELIVYDAQEYQANKGNKREVTRFHFPRQREGQHLCLADYFAPVESGRVDVVAFQVVTMGQAASEAVPRLQRAGDCAEA